MTSVNCILYATGKINMIVFQQYHVKETYSMVDPSPYFHGLFLKHTHSGSSLPGIKNFCFCTLKPLYIPMRHGCNSAHTLHYIEHQTFCLK